MLSEATLVFPHQLFRDHPAIGASRVIVLIEDSLLFGGDPHHPQRFHAKRLVLFRAAMKAAESNWRSLGHATQYVEHQAGVVVGDVLEKLAADGLRKFWFCNPVDDILGRRLRRFFEGRSGIEWTELESPNFLTPPDWSEEYFSKKKPFMAKFYEEQRKRMGILLDDEGKPRGGKWSFDEENRKSMPKDLDVPSDPMVLQESEFVTDAKEYVRKNFPDAIGSVEGFGYPVTWDEADSWFEDFLVRRFKKFGPYEDAISCRERVLFHSVLTPALNCGLLSPQGVVDRALSFAEKGNGVELNSLEGFVRQVIGWREFIRIMYDRHGAEMRNGNFWKCEDREIPESFYTGETGIAPVDDAIKRALEHGWCHHIERLMILGNFMLLCRFPPDRVYQWFMELFVDAYDWVMVPNVYGMSQFADGGIFATKPYFSGSNYVRKMSDYKKGEWCDVWDGLFWSFIDDHRDFFLSQYRLAMMARSLDRMGSEKLSNHRKKAEQFLANL